MLRHVARPFITEVKSRRGRFQNGTPPAFDPDDHFSGDERPPRDVHEDIDDSYQKALRAADRAFDPGSSPQPFFDPAPIPPAPIPSRNDSLGAASSVVSDARKTAESFFKAPAFDPPSSEQPDINLSSTSEQPTSEQPTAEAAHAISGGAEARRVLQDLTAQPDELERRLAAAPVRRGRKPGSKNRSKAPVFHDDHINETGHTLEAGAEAQAPRRRGRPPGSLNKAKPVLHLKAPSLPGPDVTPVAKVEYVPSQLPVLSPGAELVAKAVVATVFYRSGRGDASKLKVGEKWKARLPALARRYAR